MINRIFDTTVQKLKYDVLKALIQNAYEHNIDNIYVDIPKAISPGPKAQLRCCIYKERAILQERIKLILGGDKSNPNMLEIIDIACDECPIDGIYVTPSCRGCITHKCKESCPTKAISVVDKKAVVDNAKCIECGKCSKVCPYNAILQQRRPCAEACKVDAININDNTKKAIINNDKCVQCGACSYQCPFGAISDKSYIMDAVDILQKSGDNKNYNVYAVVAPAIAGQFKYAKTEQVISGIIELGFFDVVEAALGAGIVLEKEVKEWNEKSLLLTSCCPSFVMYVQKKFPELSQHISHTSSPMVEAAKLIKQKDATARVIFIGPCLSKKHEYKLEKTQGAIDCVISFEELQAFFDARHIEIEKLKSTPLDKASRFGKMFAKSGGIVAGITNAAQKLNYGGLKPVAMNGLSECKANLSKLKFNRTSDNFFEGMACEGGCINGALCLFHGAKNS